MTWKKAGCVNKCKPSPRRKGLSGAAWDAPTRSATIIIGQNKGHQPESRSAHCTAAPEVFSSEGIDLQFQRLRAEQVGRRNVAATRYQNRGWYKGQPEPSMGGEVVELF